MIIIISPAKTLDFETKVPATSNTDIRFPKEATALVKQLKKLKPAALSELMSISSPLATLNHHRFQLWQHPFNEAETRAALFAFKGDVYTGIDAYSLNTNEVDYANSHLRILSGLYGLLRPLDNIMPYRLEMGTKLEISSKKNLYDFWGDKITKLLLKDMNENKEEVLINLASNEYFKSIDRKKLKKQIVTPVFKDQKNGEYKVISFFAKKARGLMTRFIIQNRIENPDDLRAFDLDGYYYHQDLSKPDMPTFVRDHP
ncbi:peroxide stress protein YaaA [Carboxylicivirga caseinilyticus]|uniref:peroxide stress protein YaaA n=1 Tax=Carboxylicivirga caseinilyticus TaxID=3417572 RepID=UPI003D3484B2|nr:peroxide stress protein YaaA [Marinilabiliaceae bacterium A049]